MVLNQEGILQCIDNHLPVKHQARYTPLRASNYTYVGGDTICVYNNIFKVEND